MIRFTTRVVINRTSFSRTVKRQVHPQINEALVELRGIIAEQFGGVKTGRIYRRARGVHQASAPGEPPAIDSGELLRSIGQPHFPAPNMGQLRITAPYARSLEFGTGRIAARPFVHPAIRLLIQRRRRKGGRL